MVNFKKLLKFIVFVVLALSASHVFAESKYHDYAFCEQLFVDRKDEMSLAGDHLVYSDKYIEDIFHKRTPIDYQKQLKDMARKANYSLRKAREDDRYKVGAVSLNEELTRFLLIGVKEGIIPCECLAASLTRTAEAHSYVFSGCSLTYINDALAILKGTARKSKFVEKEIAIAKKKKHGIENLYKLSFVLGGSIPCKELPGMREKLDVIIRNLKK
jgi:hypothetical protein